MWAAADRSSGQVVLNDVRDAPDVAPQLIIVSAPGKIRARRRPTGAPHPIIVWTSARHSMAADDFMQSGHLDPQSRLKVGTTE